MYSGQPFAISLIFCASSPGLLTARNGDFLLEDEDEDNDNDINKENNTKDNNKDK